MGKKSTPPPPDYKAAAEAQAQGSKEAIEAQTRANRPTMETPWGTSAWSQNAQGDWTNKVTLAGDQQQALNDQMAIQAGKSGIAQGMLGRLGQATSTPFDWSNMQAYGQGGQAGGLQAGNLQAGGDLGRQRVEAGLLNRLAPQQQRETAGLESRLAGMGLTRGSSQWQREMQRLGDQQQRAQFNALEMGGQEQARQFGMMAQAGAQNFGQQQAALGQNFQQQMQLAGYQNQLRQQQIGEQQLRRSLPLNELNALLTGAQVANPSFGSFTNAGAAQGPQYMQAAQSQYGAGMDAYNAKQQQTQGMLSGIAGAAAMFMSDRRLKSGLVRVGRHPIGVAVYEYTIAGRRERGVIAQELLLVAPELVHAGPHGYLMVNYGGL